MHPYWDSEKVVRSKRRKKTVGARVKDGELIVSVPDWYTDYQAERALVQMRNQMAIKLNKKFPPLDLKKRAQTLNETFLEGQAKFTDIWWVNNQNSRWGSCSPYSGRIRLSARLQFAPGYVIDCVLIHELVHTFVRGGHNKEFYKWAHKAPHYDRAQGYLEAFGVWAKREPIDINDRPREPNRWEEPQSLKYDEAACNCPLCSDAYDVAKKYKVMHELGLFSAKQTLEEIVDEVFYSEKGIFETAGSDMPSYFQTQDMDDYPEEDVTWYAPDPIDYGD
ncbi:MAG: M48 family metallopeptidase [Corynebacterium sp.]|nr:M48 family metallopeptidase [Corynebacterium sp.]